MLILMKTSKKTKLKINKIFTLKKHHNFPLNK